MTNYEKYKDELITQLRTGDCDLFKLALEAKNKKCEIVACSECRKLTADWLTEEYKEPPVDWSKVAVDTPVLVSYDGEYWFNRYFAKYEDGIAYTWANGATSWSITVVNAFNAWDYIKLYEE